MKICWPWKNLGCLGFKGDDWYFDIHLTKKYFEVGRFYFSIKLPVVFIAYREKWMPFKPKFLCKHCRPQRRFRCLQDGYCNSTATRIHFPFRIINN